MIFFYKKHQPFFSTLPYPKGKYIGKKIKNKAKNEEINYSLPTPEGFLAEIKFYPQNILIKKAKEDLIYYYDTLIEKYKELKLVITKPNVSAKLFEKISSLPNIKRNIKAEALLPAIYETQIKIRNVEILNFLELKKNQKTNGAPTSQKTNKDNTLISKQSNPIHNSDAFLKIIDAQDNIRFSKLAKHLKMSIKEIVLLFKEEGIAFENNPMAKIPSNAVRIIINKLSNTAIPFVFKDFVLEQKTEENNLPDVKLVENIDEAFKTNLLLDELKEVDLELLIIPTNLKELKEKIEKIEQQQYVKSVVLQQFIRNEYIKEYAKIRAKGICELCEQKAPFNDLKNKPFLEVHHIIWLSKGGSDSIENVTAICPNCHRKIHNLNLPGDSEKLLHKRTKS